MPFYERDYYASGNYGSYTKKPVAVYALMIAIGASFVLFEIIIPWLFPGFKHELDQAIILNVYDLFEKFKIWQLLTYGLIHGNPLHLMLNALGLWLIGRTVNHTMGNRRFLILVMISVVFGGLLHSLLFAMGIVTGLKVIGISAGVFGILAYFCARFPNQDIMLFPLPISFKAKWFLILAVGISIVLLFYRGESNVSHAAHLGGAFVGILWVQIITKRNPDEGGNQFQSPYLAEPVKEKKSFFERKKEKKEQKKTDAKRKKQNEIRDKVDKLLDKIKAEGISSLTDKEKDFLKKSSKDFKKN